jgi:tetratricopeptide (TPR) repeat protein
LGDLSTALWDLGDPGWRQYLEQSIEINRRLPDGKVNLATSLSNLADSYLEEGDTTRAELVSRESLAIRKELFGTNSSPVAFALARLGTVFLAQSNYSAALAAAEEAVRLDEALLPPDHRDIQFILRLQGRSLNLLNRPAEAEPVLRRAREIASKAYGADHPSVHGIAGLLAESLVAQNRKGEALELMEAALPFMRQSTETTPQGSHQRKRLSEYEQLTEELRRAAGSPSADVVR